jgi:hypothetical protein
MRLGGATGLRCQLPNRTAAAVAVAIRRPPGRHHSEQVPMAVHGHTLGARAFSTAGGEIMQRAVSPTLAGTSKFVNAAKSVAAGPDRSIQIP